MQNLILKLCVPKKSHFCLTVRRKCFSSSGCKDKFSNLDTSTLRLLLKRSLAHPGRITTPPVIMPLQIFHVSVTFITL